ncbi:hypothetical protein JL722_3662 [Aureococcus anophagefferens]|nr:hypothetical protein JL722_3662 [Aureococcus anophagefferens]
MDGEAGDGAAWWSLFGALHVNVAVAPVFAFGVMAPSFGRLAGSSPGGTAAIGVAANAGLWLNVVPGYAYDARGPRFATAVGLGLALAGYGATATRAGAAAAAAGWFAVGHGSAWIYTATLLHNVTNFEVDARGSGRETTIGDTTMMSIVQLYDACLFGTVDAAGACAGGWFGGEKLLPFLGLAARRGAALNLALAAPARGRGGRRPGARAGDPRRAAPPRARARRLRAARRRRRGPRGRRGADLGAARARRDRAPRGRRGPGRVETTHWFGT